MKMKKIWLLMVMVLLSGGLVFGEVKVSEACDSTLFEGVESCDPATVPPTYTFTPAGGRSADWWCATPGCINDCYEWGSGLFCGGDDGDDADIDYRFCGSDGDIYEVSCSKDATCVGDDGGDCDASVTKVTDCPECDANGYNYSVTCSLDAPCERTGVSAFTKCIFLGTSKSCDDGAGGCCSAIGNICVPDGPDADTIEDCVAPPSTAMNLSIEADDNPVEVSNTTDIDFTVTKASDGSAVSGATVTITSISCGTLPNPGSTTDASGETNSTFTAPGGANICTITAKATKAGLDDAIRTYSISVVSANCIDRKIIFNKGSIVGKPVEVCGNSLALDLVKSCVRLYKGGVTQDTDNSIGPGMDIGCASVASATVGTWQGGLFIKGPCGAYAAADCQVELKIVECEDDGDCSGTDICNNNKCEIAAGPGCDPIGAACTAGSCCAGLTCDVGVTDTCIVAAGPGCDPIGAACTAGSCCAGLTCDVGVTDTCIVAAGPGPGPAACDPDAWFFCNPLRGSVETLAEGGEQIVGYILGLIGSIALLLIIISGAMYMTSAGNEERIATSKRVLTGAVIGLGIALLAYSLLAVIMKVLGV